MTGVDRSPEAIAACTGLGELICADIGKRALAFARPAVPGRGGHQLPVAPLAAAVLASLAPGGVLIYETFAQGHETVGRPSRA